MPTNNQPGASVGPFPEPWRVENVPQTNAYYVIDATDRIVVNELPEKTARLIASAPTLLAENEALRAAVAEYRISLLEKISYGDALDDVEEVISDFDATFDPLTGAKGGDDES